MEAVYIRLTYFVACVYWIKNTGKYLKEIFNDFKNSEIEWKIQQNHIMCRKSKRRKL